jgi:hypothetical protein
MKITSASSALAQRLPIGMLVLAFACSAALFGSSPARAQTGGQSGTSVAAPVVSATLEECVTASVQSERAVTFAGEMTAIPGTARMSMRFDVEERAPGEVSFHTVSAPGLGVWRASETKVKTYRYLKQVTNLASPAVYRALVHFRWTSAKGHAIKRTERMTPRCAQLATAPTPAPPTTEASSPSSSTALSPAV